MSARRLSPALFVSVLCSLVVVSSAHADRDFTPRFSTNDTGDVSIAANALMTCPETAAGCTQARQGVGALSQLQNNSYAMTYIDVDGDAATFNSSRATVDLPAGAQVLFAGLYFGGDTAGTGADASRRNRAKLRAPGDSAYREIVADVVDDSTQAGRYQSFKDVTSIVAAVGRGSYTVADVQAGRGNDRYAGWSLVVAYRDTAQPARNLTVFDGLRTVANVAGGTINVSGFRTPPAGPVRTSLGFVVYEGDLGIEGDSAALNSTTLGDAQSPATNFFNSSVSRRGARIATKEPDYVNLMAVDADVVSADGILANNATSATIRLSTSGDVFIPGVVTFATELFAPRIEQTKTATDVNGGQLEEGDILEYRIAGTNTGQDGATAFVVRDPIPSGTSYVSGSITTAGTARTDAAGDDVAEISGGQVVARVGAGATATTGGAIAPGAGYEVRFRVRLDRVLADRSTIDNTVTSSYVSQSLGTPLTAVSTARSTVAAPDLTIAKTRRGPLVPGASGTYDLTVTNVGSAPTNGDEVVVLDDLPAGLTATAAAGAGWVCAVLDSGRRVRCTRSDRLAAGASYPSIRLDVAVADNASGRIENTGRVSGGGDANAANDFATDPADPEPAADLAVTKVARSATASPGDEVVFDIGVRNDGPSAVAAAVVTDTLPAGLELLEATPSQGTCTIAIRCDLGALRRGASATIVVRARVQDAAGGTTVRNTAQVSGSAPDPNRANDSASADVTIRGTDLAVTKTQVGTATAGGTATFDLTVTNVGAARATGVILTDTPPGALTPVGLPAGCTTVGGTVSCALPDLAPGASASRRLTFAVRQDARGTLRNAAAVDSAEDDVDPADNAAVLDFGVDTPADLSLVKTSERTEVEQGQTFAFTLRVRNAGPARATGVQVVDELPAGLEYVGGPAGCTPTGRTVRCTVASLAAGEESVLRLDVRVAGDAAGTLVNVATVTGEQADPDRANDTGSAAVAVVDRADLSLTKTAESASVRPGEVTSFRLTVRNDGPATARDVVLSDTIPAGLTATGAPAGCSLDGDTVRCEVGSLAPGATFVAVVQATADAVALPNDHRHLLTIGKVESQVDLEPGQQRTLELACAPGGVMTDASIRVDAVDQGTGTLADVKVVRLESDREDRYAVSVINTVTGRAQAKAFGVCVTSPTGDEQGHAHGLVVSDPVASTVGVGSGRRELRVSCGEGQIAIAPGFVAAGGDARLLTSVPDGNGRRFVVESADGGAVTVSARCLDRTTADAQGHVHDLGLTQVDRTVTVPAGQTVTERVTCADDAKGIVASYDLGPGLLPAGNDPQPKSRDFRIVNPTDGALTARIGLLCLNDRTNGPTARTTVTNTASVRSSTPDPDTGDLVASASIRVEAGDVRPPGSATGATTSGGSPRSAPRVAGAARVRRAVLRVALKASGIQTGTAKLVRSGKTLSTARYRTGSTGTGTVQFRLGKQTRRLHQTGKLRRATLVLRTSKGVTRHVTITIKR